MLETALPLLKKLLPADFPLYLKTRWIDGHFRLRTPDRIFLEETIIPWFRDHEQVNSVLDVGCDWYTRSYPGLIGAERHETIDLDPDKERHATGHRHHVGSLLDLDRFCEPDAFDLLICNGVLGWGINGRLNIEAAAGQIARAVRPGGWVVLGWNDVEPWRPECIQCFGRAPFEHRKFPPIATEVFVTETKSRHTYRFLQIAAG